MILPIIAYGSSVLRKRGENIDQNYLGLQELISNMFETMYNASGVGLAAPQVGKSIRLFVVDTSRYVEEGVEDKEELRKFRKVLINPEIFEENGNEWPFNEGCLSIPDIREDVERTEKIRIRYLDQYFTEHEEVYGSLKARVIQHEYDHIEGILFIDYLSPLRKRVLKTKLNSIAMGKVSVNYKMKFPELK